MSFEAISLHAEELIAYRLHIEKGNLAAMAAVRDGKIGEPRIVRSRFCQQVIPGNSCLQDELGGGPLYDTGVYRINAARYMFRAEPKRCSPMPQPGSKMNASRKLTKCPWPCCDFPDARLAGFRCRFGAADRSTFEVIGTKGVVKMDPAYEMVGDVKC